MASTVAGKIGDSAVEAKDLVIEKATEAEERVASVAAERLPEVKEAATEAAEKVVETVSRVGETAIHRLRHPTRYVQPQSHAQEAPGDQLTREERTRTCRRNLVKRSSTFPTSPRKPTTAAPVPG